MTLQDGQSQVTNANLNNLIGVYNSNNGIQKIIGTTTEFSFNYNTDDSANYQGKTSHVVITANGTEYARQDFTFE